MGAVAPEEPLARDGKGGGWKRREIVAPCAGVKALAMGGEKEAGL